MERRRGDTNTDIRDDKVQETRDFRRISHVYFSELNGLKIRRGSGIRMMKLTAASAGTLAVMVALGLGVSAQSNPPSKTPAAPQQSSPKPVMAVAHKTDKATVQP